MRKLTPFETTLLIASTTLLVGGLVMIGVTG